MKRSVIFAVLLIGSLIYGMNPAVASTNRACVTRAEYRRVHAGMTQTEVRKIFDVRGRTVSFTEQDLGFDKHVTYRKCRSFSHGRGRVTIDFDDYSYEFMGYAFRVYEKRRNNTY